MSLIRFTLLGVVLLATASAAFGQKTKVVPNKDWGAIFRDDTLKKEAPKGGLITDAKTFEKLWKAWRKDEKVPKVDFKKEFIVVSLSSGPNRVSMSATIDEGDLKIQSVQTLIGGNGFGY